MTLLVVLAVLPVMVERASHVQSSELAITAAETGNLADVEMECCDQVDGKPFAKGYSCSIDCHYLMVSSVFTSSESQRSFELGSAKTFNSYDPRIQPPPPRTI